MPSTICRHIRSNGLRCGSPALREKPYCYHHYLAHSHKRALTDRAAEGTGTVLHSMVPGADAMQRNPVLAPYLNPKPEPMTLNFPPLEDRESIAVALSMVLGALARKRIEAKEATPLIYGLQVASANAKNFHGQGECRAVTEVVVDEHGEELAPDEDPAPPWEGLEDYYDDDEEADEEDGEESEEDDDDEEADEEDGEESEEDDDEEDGDEEDEDGEDDEADGDDEVEQVEDSDEDAAREERAAVWVQDALEKMLALRK